MRKQLVCLIPIALMLAANPAASCDEATGERQQLVFLDWNGQHVGDWIAEPGDMQSIRLPDGFQLGIRLDQTAPDAIPPGADHGSYKPELVQINVFDMSTPDPVRLTTTYGGTNSIQGYGSRGGADRIEALGNPGIRLTLLKPNCVASNTATAQP